MSPKTFALLWWLSSAAWAAQIFWASTGTLGSSRTRSWLTWLLSEFGFALSRDGLWLLHLATRKSAHFLQYGIFAALLYQALTAHHRWQAPAEPLPSRRIALVSAVLAAVYAATDELHQLFVAGRGASFSDWLIDLAGALLIVCVLHSRQGPYRPPPAGLGNPAKEIESSAA